jgi:hypothetical protein
MCMENAHIQFDEHSGQHHIIVNDDTAPAASTQGQIEAECLPVCKMSSCYSASCVRS